MTVKIDGYFSKAKGDVTRQINPQILKYFWNVTVKIRHELRNFKICPHNIGHRQLFLEIWQAKTHADSIFNTAISQ